MKKNIIGKRARALREAAGLDLETIARRMMQAGFPVTPKKVADLEAARCRVTDIEALALAGALNVEIDELFAK